MKKSNLHKWNKLQLNIYRTFAPRLLWMQIFCILLFLTLSPLIFFIYIQYHDIKSTLESPILQYQKDIAKTLTGEIQKSFNVTENSLIGLASILGAIKTDYWKQKIAITEMVSNSIFFRKITSLNDQGMEVSSSQQEFTLKDRSQDPIWLTVKSNKIYISDVYITSDHIPSLTLAVPIKFTNKIIGALIAEINLRVMWEDVDNLKNGKTGIAYLVDQKGRIITHPNKKLIFQDNNLLFKQSTLDVIAENSGSHIAADLNGNKWFVAYAPIKKLHWGLLYIKSKTEVYAPFISQIRRTSIITAIPAILLSLIFSYIAARLFVKPIHKFIDETKKLLKGDFIKKSPVFRKDELGEITYYFNRLIHKYNIIKNKEKLAKIGEETTAVTHEIKNSLHMIRTYIKLLPERHKNKKFMKEFEEIIPSELDSLKDKMQDIGQFSHKTELSFEKIEILSFLNTIILRNKLLIQENHINFVFENHLHKNQNYYINGDSFHLKRVFANLFKNAIEATPENGTITLCVELSKKKHKWFQKQSSYINIMVKNTGKGIAKDLLKTIFEPFCSTKKYNLGLGLAICKQIIQRHNGEITVHSIENKETCFTVHLPTINMA